MATNSDVAKQDADVAATGARRVAEAEATKLRRRIHLPPELGTPWSGPVDPFESHWWRRILLPLALVVALAGWMILREADRLVGGIVDPDGRSATVGDATGVFALLNTDVWEIWASATKTREQLPTFVAGYVVGDVLFIAGYLVLFWVLVGWSRFATLALALTVVVDFAEGVFLLIAANAAADDVSIAGPDLAFAWVSTSKWILLGLTFAAALLVGRSRHAIVGRFTRMLVALWAHRLTVIFVVGIGVLALSPFSGIFDQLPDVQRDWFGGGGWLSAWGAAGPIIGAGILLAVAAWLFWYFGRRRTERVYRRFLESEDWAPGDPAVTWWVAVPVAALAVAVMATYADSRWWWQLTVALVCLALVVAAASGAQLGLEGRPRVRLLVPFLVVGLLGAWAWLTDAGEMLDASYLVVLFAISVLVLGGSGLLKLAWTKKWISEPKIPFTSSRGVKQLIEAGTRGGGWGEEPDASSWGDPASDFTPAKSKEQAKRAFEPATKSSTKTPDRPNPRADMVRTSWLVGDSLAVMVLALAPLGLIRSLTGPALVSVADPTTADVPGVWVWLILAILLGVAVVWLAVWGLHAVEDSIRELPAVDKTRRLSRTLIDPRLELKEGEEAVVIYLDAAAVVFGAAVIGFATFLPETFSHLGPVGVTVLLLLGWSLVVGGIILSLQRGKPMPIFRQVGLNSTPVIALMTIFMFVMSLLFAPAEVHGLRTSGDLPPRESDVASSTDERLSDALGARFRAWLRDAPGCGQAPTPLVLIAAEGGGGRAAYWTVEAMAELQADPCLGPGLFAASGVSGGSVGLAVDQLVAARTKDAHEDGAGKEITALTGSYPLARVVSGLLAGDFVAAVTGVRVPTVNDAWLDRAGHLEVAWEDAVDSHDDFRDVAPPRQPFLVLNSADSVSGCRVSVTQLPFAGGPQWDGEDRLTADDCSEPGTGAGFTLEFDEIWPDCSNELPWSTAAMLSARFPFVTPGGRMPVPEADSCSGAMNADEDLVPQAQLVDGGYSESSGLGALSDLLPEIVKLVAVHNACVATVATQVETKAERRAARGATDRRTPGLRLKALARATVAECGASHSVMPVVVYLKNDRGFEVDAEVERLAAEFLVPLAGAKSKGLQNSEAAWLQRLSDALSTDKPAQECGASPICRNPVVVVSAATSPTLAAPLGWTLSQFSRDSLDSALKANRGRCGTVDGYSTYGELLELFGDSPCP